MRLISSPYLSEGNHIRFFSYFVSVCIFLSALYLLFVGSTAYAAAFPLNSIVTSDNEWITDLGGLDDELSCEYAIFDAIYPSETGAEVAGLCHLSDFSATGPFAPIDLDAYTNTSGEFWISITNVENSSSTYYVRAACQGSNCQAINVDFDFDFTENFIVITEPVLNTPYDTTIRGAFNKVSGTSATTTYRITFLSQTGIDYDDLVIVASSTEDFFEFEHEVQFEADDIVYVRAYLYDDDSENASKLIDISEEYEWWVSANANPTQAVDLGMFRTGTTTFCGEAGSALDFAWGTCQAFRLLFVPNESSLEYISSRVAIATSTVPFSYMYDVSGYFNTIFASSSSAWSIAMPTTTPVFGGVVLLSSSQVDDSTLYQIIRTVLGIALLLLIPVYYYRRTKIISASL